MGLRCSAFSAQPNASSSRSGQEVRQRHSGLHAEHQRIHRAVTHGALEVMDRELRFAEPAPDKPLWPSGSEALGLSARAWSIRASALLVLAQQAGQGEAARGQGQVVVVADLGMRSPGAVSRRRPARVGHPSGRPAHAEAAQRQPIGRRVIGIELDRASQPQGLFEAVAAPSMEVRQRAHVGDVRIEALGRLAARANHFGVADLRHERADHARRPPGPAGRRCPRGRPRNGPPRSGTAVAASTSWPVMRRRLPALRTLPSST